MAGAPPVGPGQVSPDGMWRWDGTRWVRAVPRFTVPRRTFNRVLAGCSTLLVLVAVGAGYEAYSFVHGFMNGSVTCLPSDFPRYPVAIRASQSFDLTGWDPRGGTCHIVFASNDDVDTVTAFYESKLNTGDWLAASTNPAGQVSFQLAKTAEPFGTVHVAVSLGRQPFTPASLNDPYTEITIDLFSLTCLHPKFPRYPGTRFGGQNYAATVRRECHIVFESNDKVATVKAFYERELDTGHYTGGWQVTSSTASQVGFKLWHPGKRGGRTDVSGTVNIVISGKHTEIRIDAFS